MRYLGGKSRIARKIAAIINPIRGNRPLWDPFCGGLSTAVAFGGEVVASDVHPALIWLYRIVAAGWIPPSDVSVEDYYAAKALPDFGPLKAFAGFGCSFGGKYFGGYAFEQAQRMIRSGAGEGIVMNCQSMASASREALLRDVPKFIAGGGSFDCIDFLDVEPFKTDAVLYLDPPYRGVTEYSIPFDFDAFDQRVREWSGITEVFVSEYRLPYGREIWVRAPNTCGMNNGKRPDRPRERLYWVPPAAYVEVA